MDIVSCCATSILLISSMQEINSNLSIELTGNIFFSSKYLTGDNVTIKNKIEIENLITDIIKRYANAGFPFCSIYPEIIYTDSTITKVILKIDEGKRITISDCFFDIQGKTDRGAAKKIANLKVGKYFSKKEIEYSKRNLMKTDVFEGVGDNIIYRDGNYYLLFNLKEKKTDYLTALGSLGGDTYNFSISFYSLNLLGTLRRLQFRYEYQKLFSLQFTEPILIFPAELNGNFSLWTYDSLRLIQFYGKFIAPLGHYFKVSLMTGVEAVSYYGDSTEAYQHTNNILGIGFSFDYETSTWSCAQSINFDYLFRHHERRRVQYDGEFNIIRFHIKPHYYISITDSFEYFDYYRIGGAKTLRGYFEEEFIVAEAMWLNIEYKKFFIFPIFDIGLLQNNIEFFNIESVLDNIKFSYGFGLEAKSNFADASLAIAWPRHGTWRDGKIHLMLAKGF